jgi:hypothetical protein
LQKNKIYFDIIFDIRLGIFFKILKKVDEGFMAKSNYPVQIYIYSSIIYILLIFQYLKKVNYNIFLFEFEIKNVVSEKHAINLHCLLNKTKLNLGDRSGIWL